MEVLTVSLDGFGELEKALKTIGPRAARRAGAKAMRAATKPIIDRAKVLVPVLTGRLEDSITSAPNRTNVEKELKIAIGFRRPASGYAHLVEFGTSHSAAQPFMRPAIDTKAMAAIKIMGAEMWKGIAKEADSAKKGKKK